MKKASNKTYVVQVNAPPAAKALACWNYPLGYFPRSFHYKAEAVACAELAIKNGATMSRVECPNGVELDFRPGGRPVKSTPRHLMKLQQGDSVWVAYCYEMREGGYKSSVSERIFERVYPNYLGKGEDRFVLVFPGRPFGKGYGTAYKPSRVYRTRDEAVIVLREMISAKINAWREALDRAF